MARNDGTVVMEGVRLIFRNFAGKESEYNREGDRNFGVIIDQVTANQLLEDGWNVKYLRPQEGDEEGEETPWLPVTVNFKKGRPPLIKQITSKKHTVLGEHEAEILDWVDIIEADMIIRPYAWEVNGKTGIKAYLQSLYVKIEENPLEAKWDELDPANQQ